MEAAIPRRSRTAAGVDSLVNCGADATGAGPTSSSLAEPSLLSSIPPPQPPKAKKQQQQHQHRPSSSSGLRSSPQTSSQQLGPFNPVQVARSKTPPPLNEIESRAMKHLDELIDKLSSSVENKEKKRHINTIDTVRECCLILLAFCSILTWTSKLYFRYVSLSR